MSEVELKIVGDIILAVLGFALTVLTPFVFNWLVAKKEEAKASMSESELKQAEMVIQGLTMAAEQYNLDGRLQEYANSKFEFVKQKAAEAFPKLPVASIVALIEKSVAENFNSEKLFK